MASKNDLPPPAPPRAGGGMSLYANLLNQDASTTVSSAPVMYTQKQQEEAAAAAAQKRLNDALRFQPVKRPQASSQKTKAKPTFARVAPTISTTTAEGFAAASPPPAPAVKSNLADWTSRDDDIYDYNPNANRERGGRKKRKKNKKEEEVVTQNWDDIYDPSRPNIYEQYKGSDEKYLEIKDWKDKLHGHRAQSRRPSDDYSEESDRGRSRFPRNFGPPSNTAFAPPASYNDNPPPPPPAEEEYVPPPPPTKELHNDATGEDAYARRMRLSQMPNAPPTDFTHPPPPPPLSQPVQSSPEPQAPLPPNAPLLTQATLPTPELLPAQTPLPALGTVLPQAPIQPFGLPVPTISRAPVIYNLPPAPSELPATEAELEQALVEAAKEEEQPADDEERPSRPSKKGFGLRMMSKMGWTKGQGLGADGTGMVNPLRVEIEKRKKRSDAEGGGFVGPAGKGKIIAGKMGKGKTGESAEGAGSSDANAQATDDGPGMLSEVVVLRGMVDGLDLAKEMSEGTLIQEIGQECGEKYGIVERVFIHQYSSDPSKPVFIKFTSAVSALRAVQALEGRIFNGNVIKARYYETEKFEKGEYE